MNTYNILNVIASWIVPENVLSFYLHIANSSKNEEHKAIIEEAARLIGELANLSRMNQQHGSMSVSIYDTAWASMIVTKAPVKDGDEYRWLFPESFAFLLRSQLDDGSWNVTGSEIDGLLNTLSACLALVKHRDNTACPHSSSVVAVIEKRIYKAVCWLQLMLQEWEIGECDRVGFEILVPTLLALLAENGINLTFTKLEALQKLNMQKLARFDHRILESDHPTTLLHSLEGLIGKIDFDKISHRKVNGGMLASPSSTAAYIMYSTEWDDEAANYLRRAFEMGSGKGCGGFPSAFPSEIFEISWVLSTMLESGFSKSVLGDAEVDSLAAVLEKQLSAQDGVVGFTAGVVADADDTSKSLETLYLLGRVDMDPTKLIAKFDNGYCFSTYEKERNPSFSANCNALKCLLKTPKPNLYISSINKASSFLCNAWYDGPTNDKWNLSAHYTNMLLSQALMQLMDQWVTGDLAGLTLHTIQNQVPVILTEILSRTLLSQEENGSWNESCEETAYAILALTCCFGTPWVLQVRPDIQLSIDCGRNYLENNRHNWGHPDPVWIEKVSFSSPVLSLAYCLAAMNAPLSSLSWPEDKMKQFVIHSGAFEKFSAFFSKLPLLSNLPDVKLVVALSLIEAHLFLPALKDIRHHIFSREGMTADKYFEYIPVAWTLSNNLGVHVHTSILYEMMIISIFNYQVDEYMEKVVEKRFGHNLAPIRELVTGLCETPSEDITPNTGLVDVKKKHTYAEELSNVAATLSRFISFVLDHEKVLQNASDTRRQLRHELCNFLLAHIDQIEDSARLASERFSKVPPQISPTSMKSKLNYFEWVRTTSADHTSCPYSFKFFCCLISNGEEFFVTAKQKYLSEDLCRHLATMCRQYNDYGSVARDRAEDNLNSLDFNEFHHDERVATSSSNCHDSANGNKSETSISDKKKDELFWLAEYERSCMEKAKIELQKEMSPSLTRSLKLFINVTDIFGQIYVLKDIASRLK